MLRTQLLTCFNRVLAHPVKHESVGYYANRQQLEFYLQFLGWILYFPVMTIVPPSRIWFGVSEIHIVPFLDFLQPGIFVQNLQVICNHLRQAEKSAKHWSQKEAEFSDRRSRFSVMDGKTILKKPGVFPPKTHEPDSIGGMEFQKMFFQKKIMAESKSWPKKKGCKFKICADGRQQGGRDDLW